MKKYIVLGLIAAMVVAMAPAMAADFSMNATDFAASMIMNTISNLKLSGAFLDFLYKVKMTQTQPAICSRTSGDWYTATSLFWGGTT